MFFITQNCSTDSAIGEDFQKQTMCDSSIENMHTGYSVFNGINAVIQLWKHTAADISVCNQFFCIGNRKFGNQGGRIFRIFVYSLDIG